MGFWRRKNGVPAEVDAYGAHKRTQPLTPILGSLPPKKRGRDRLVDGVPGQRQHAIQGMLGTLPKVGHGRGFGSALGRGTYLFPFTCPDYSHSHSHHFGFLPPPKLGGGPGRGFVFFDLVPPMLPVSVERRGHEPVPSMRGRRHTIRLETDGREMKGVASPMG